MLWMGSNSCSLNSLPQAEIIHRDAHLMWLLRLLGRQLHPGRQISFLGQLFFCLELALARQSRFFSELTLGFKLILCNAFSLRNHVSWLQAALMLSQTLSHSFAIP